MQSSYRICNMYFLHVVVCLYMVCSSLHFTAKNLQLNLQCIMTLFHVTKQNDFVKFSKFLVNMNRAMPKGRTNFDSHALASA